jgi:hypothetical protein
MNHSIIISINNNNYINNNTEIKDINKNRNIQITNFLNKYKESDIIKDYNIYFSSNYYILYSSDWKLIYCFKILKRDNIKTDNNIRKIEYSCIDITPIEIFQSKNIQYNSVKGYLNLQEGILIMSDIQIHLKLKNI